MKKIANSGSGWTLPKAPTGIQGLDEISSGGLPRGRLTLVCGGAGCGKTLLAMEFLARGATEFGEPGVFMAFEETSAELADNVRSLGFDVTALVEKKKLVLDFVRVERHEIEETGDYDLEGLFVRLGYAIDSIGAKRVVLDTLETLFGGLTNQGVIRAELRRLFRWLKDKGVTAVVTAENGENTLTRHGLEEYVSDCVIVLDHRVVDRIATRRLRIVKFRGSFHGTNEYPFLIDEKGLSVLPITSLGLFHEASNKRVSTGIPRLDALLGGSGYFRGSTVLISGPAGAGKTSIAAYFAHATCERGERCLFFSFEESPAQVMRNMGSIGLDLEQWVKKGLLRFHAIRPSSAGLELHLVRFHQTIRDFKPHSVILDPIGALIQAGESRDAATMVMRLVDFMKLEGITCVLTNLTALDKSKIDIGISSLVDTWLRLQDIEVGGERNRGILVLKSRGMGHSNQVREFVITDRGIEVLDVYLGAGGVLTGSARRTQEAAEKNAAAERISEIEGKVRDLERRRQTVEAYITAMRKEFEAEAQETGRMIAQLRAHEDELKERRRLMAVMRQADKKTDETPRPSPRTPRRRR